jgi:hypothetical protein
MTATWPADWDAMLAGEGCSMCAKGRPDDDGFGVRIQAAKYSDAYLQRADMQRGYTLVIWRGRHVAEPTELEAAEAAGYWLEVLRVAEALQRYYRPLKMNYEVAPGVVTCSNVDAVWSRRPRRRRRCSGHGGGMMVVCLRPTMTSSRPSADCGPPSVPSRWLRSSATTPGSGTGGVNPGGEDGGSTANDP